MRLAFVLVPVMLAAALLTVGCSAPLPDTVQTSTPASTIPASTAPTNSPTNKPESCSTPWGSDVKKYLHSAQSQIIGMHAEQHDCFDRLIFDLAPSASGYFAEYADGILADGSGMPVDVAGGAILKLVLSATTYDFDTGAPTIVFANPYEAADVAGFTMLRQIAFAGSFEGLTTFGIGVASASDFRVSVTDAGDQSQLVLDIAH